MLEPVVLFFVLGVIAGLARTELRLPPALYEFVSLYLLLAIGLKGGVELARQPLLQVAPQAAAIVLMGLVMPLLAFPVLRWLGGLPRADAAAIAAHYGSVSVGTYAVATAFLDRVGAAYEAHMPLFVVLLEVPAIWVGIMLARGGRREAPQTEAEPGNGAPQELRWGALLHEVFLGKSVYLLMGGLVVGWLAGPLATDRLGSFFFDLFNGILALFLLEMGLVAAARVRDVLRVGPFLVGFGLAMPLAGAVIGAGVGVATGFSPGGTVLVAILAASASYIAVPAAMRIAVPEARPALSLAASLGITFPFNVTLGIPLYYATITWLLGG